MLTLLVSAVLFSIVVSACCSLMEATLYAVPLPHVRHLAASGSKAGKILLRFKEDVGRPIAGVLILNTIANTAGASVAGWAVGAMYGEKALAIFSVLFILSILYLSEIMPKVVGVVYSRETAPLIAFPLLLLTRAFSPLISASLFISKALERGKEESAQISLEEVLSTADLGREQGALDHLEGSVIRNVIGLDALLVGKVLTPRVVVFRIEETRAIESLREEIATWSFSRVPLFREEDPDHLTGYVTQRDIFRELVQGAEGRTLCDIRRPLPAVPELMRVDKLLLQMFEQGEHICAVVDEHGGLAGIITLEDIIEEIVGREIVDEYDAIRDLRTFARLRRAIQGRRKEVRKGSIEE